METTAPCNAGVPPALFGVPQNHREPLQAGRLRYIEESMQGNDPNARFLRAFRGLVVNVPTQSRKDAESQSVAGETHFHGLPALAMMMG